MGNKSPEGSRRVERLQRSGAGPMNPLFSRPLVVALYVAFVLMAASGIYLVRTPLDSKSQRATQSTVNVRVQPTRVEKIGRASCRERVWILVVPLYVMT